MLYGRVLFWFIGTGSWLTKKVTISRHILREFCGILCNVRFLPFRLFFTALLNVGVGVFQIDFDGRAELCLPVKNQRPSYAECVSRHIPTQLPFSVVTCFVTHVLNSFITCSLLIPVIVPFAAKEIRSKWTNCQKFMF